MWYPATNLQLHTVSVASFPGRPRLAFCRFNTTQQATETQVAAWEWSYTVTLWLLSPRKSCIPTWNIRVSQQLQLINSYKFSCKSGLFMPSHPPHCTKQKYYTQYRQKGGLQTEITHQRHHSAMGDIISWNISGFPVNQRHELYGNTVK